MSGRWVVRPRTEHRNGLPWLVLRGDRAEAVLWNGPVLELHTRALRRLGPDILDERPDVDAMLARIRRSDTSRPVGEALLDQTLVAGIGNMWIAETLWRARLSPWRRVRDVGDAELTARARDGRLAHACVGRGGPTRARAGVRPRRPTVPALRRSDRRRGPRRRQPHRVLVPRLPARDVA